MRFLRLGMLILLLAAGAARAEENPASHRVASLERIKLGNVEQSVLIRGDDDRHPILLFLHGGPGLAEMPFSWVNRALERDFVVVQWDQRGAGKSFDPRIPLPEMTVEHFLEDTLQLTRLLLHRFRQRKLYLAGHSWGSFIGALAVAREPALFRAYIGISQFVNVTDSQRILYREGIARAESQGNTKTLAIMRKIGPPPYPNHRVERVVDRVTKAMLGGHVEHPMTPGHFAALGLLSPNYSLWDDVRLIRGISFSGHALEKEIYTDDLLKDAPELDVPVYFLEGRYDTVLSPTLLRHYFAALRAPAGKHLLWFEHADHWLFLESRDEYRAALREILRKTAPRDRQAAGGGA